jgi:asparagine synthase (glutamine-hydrolysing)
VSAVAGCFWFNGSASADDLRPSTDCAAHRARAPFHFWSSGPIALASAPAPPRYDPVTHTVTIVDGCIDNLDEVAEALGIGSDRTAGAVALAAYGRWGVDAGSRLIGDFVLIVHDERERRAVVIRDPMAQRPLFYGKTARGILFASEAQQIVRHPAMRRRINEAMVAEYLADAPATVAETLWRDVYRLPPAHALEITRGGAVVRRYWNWDPEARIQHVGSREYDEHFRELFARAVECRVRGAAAPGVLLSGGIDSSAIAGVAQALRAQAGRPPVRALTLAFPGRPCDETIYSRAVIDKWRLPAIRLEAARPPREALEEAAARYLDVPPHPNSVVADPLRAAAKASGVELLLTGAGGDDFFAGTGDVLRSLLRSGRLLAWTRAVAAPRLPERVRNVVRPLLGARPPRRPWLQNEFARSVGLDDRLRPARSLSFPTREQQEMHAVATGLGQILGDEMEDRAAHAAGILQRHPFCDRRVAEFGLALPESERSCAGRTKVLVRRALRAYLPEPVAAREDKAEFSVTYVEALEALGGPATFASLQSEAAGWVDGPVVREMSARMIDLYRRGDEAYIAYASPLWAVAALEFWLEAAGRRG